MIQLNKRFDETMLVLPALCFSFYFQFIRLFFPSDWFFSSGFK